MNRKRYVQDLAGWETGEFPHAHLEALYPDEDVAGLLSIHSRLTALGDEQVPDPGLSWIVLKRQLPERLPGFGELLRHRLRRPLIIALAGALLLLPVAALASPATRQRISNLVQMVEDVVEGRRIEQELPSDKLEERDLIDDDESERQEPDETRDAEDETDDPDDSEESEVESRDDEDVDTDEENDEDED